MQKTSKTDLTGSGKTRVDFEKIKTSTDLVRVVQSYGIELKRQGRDWVGLCPFHDDHNPSLRITPDKGLFRCPACNAAGNVIQFVARKEGISEREAAMKLLDSVPGVQRASDLTAPNPARHTQNSALLQRVVSFYSKTLFKDQAGLDYLKSRNLTDPAMLETFQIGYCNGSLKQTLPEEGELIDQLKALGILNTKGNEIFYGRVVVPIFDAAGNVCGLYGRRIAQGEPKHLYLKGEHRGVFNASCAKTAQSLFITESIFDALSLWQAGFRNVISLYGTNGWTAHHQKLIAENAITELILALDNDSQGRRAAEALQKKLSGPSTPLRAGLVQSIQVIAWPDGIKDANEFFLSRSAADFKKMLPSVHPVNPVHPVEEITVTPNGFTASYGVRRYELFSIEKPSSSRLRATIKALGSKPGRFHIDTVDFYLARSRRAFISETTRLFKEVPETIESDLNRLILQLENYVVQRLEEKNPRINLVAEQDRLEAEHLGKSPDLADQILADLQKLGSVGETTNKLIGYLTMSSRKMADPLALLILSGSGSGKSHLQDAILSLCPEEDLIKLTSLTDQALFYKGADSLRHKVLALEEETGASGAAYALRNLISAKKLAIETTIKNPLSGRLETQTNIVHGPTAVFLTTTNPSLDPETKSRFILTSIDESREQTLAILEAQRNSHTLEGLRRRHHRQKILGRHHAFQRMLKALEVVNPFEPWLTYGDNRLLVRRDNPKYLHLILAVTFLHQMQRPVKKDELTGHDYIETTLEDIALANELALDIFGHSIDDLSAPGRQLLQLITDYVRAKAERLGTDIEKITFSRRELREAIGWSDTRLRIHLQELVQLEYALPLAGGFGKTFQYRLLYDPAAGSGRFVAGLKSVEELANLAGRNVNLARKTVNLAPTSPKPTARFDRKENPHEQRLEAVLASNLADLEEEPIENFAAAGKNGASKT
jgi:DNA primase catalytic core